MKSSYAIAFTALMVSVSQSQALPVTGTGNPWDDDYFSAGTHITFEADAKGDFGHLATGGVSFVAAPMFTIGGFAAGSFNTTGKQHLSNLANLGTLRSFRFDFLPDTTAFGFNFGGSETDWVLEGFDENGSLMESLVINPLGASNNGDYFGFVNTIAYKFATLTILDRSKSDLVFIDNFVVVGAQLPSPVPVPPALPMIAAGLLSLVGVRLTRAKIRALL
jgi:hypothetical protein